MFLLRGYQDDGPPCPDKPGTVFDLTVPIWRVAEVLLHAERLTRELGSDQSQLSFEFTWEGLSGRNLSVWGNIFSNRYY